MQRKTPNFKSVTSENEPIIKDVTHCHLSRPSVLESVNTFFNPHYFQREMPRRIILQMTVLGVPIGRAIRYIFFAFQDKKGCAPIPNATSNQLFKQTKNGITLFHNHTHCKR